VAELVSAGADLYGDIPGDPAVIREQAAALARASRTRGQEALDDLRRAREVALASWHGPASHAYEGWSDRAFGRESRLVEVGEAARGPSLVYADALAREQRDHAAAREDARQAWATGTAAVPGSPEHLAAQRDLEFAEDAMGSARGAAVAAGERAAVKMRAVTADVPSPVEPPGGGETKSGAGATGASGGEPGAGLAMLGVLSGPQWLRHAAIQDIEGFFGDALDWAKGVWGSLGLWDANSLAGNANTSTYYGLGTVLGGLTHFGTYLEKAESSWSRAGGWKAAGKYAGWAAYPLAVGASGLGQYLKDEHNHPGMPLDRRIGRAIGQSVTVGGAAIVGGQIGQTLGLAGGSGAGAVFGDGAGAAPGAAIGGFVGSLAGAIAGAKVVDRYNDSTVEAFGDAAAWTEHEIHALPGQTVHAYDYVKGQYVDAYHNAQGVYQDVTHSPEYRDMKQGAELSYEYLKHRATEGLQPLQHLGTQLRETFSHPDFGAVLDDLNPLPEH
jgi:hypothetical protein